MRYRWMLCMSFILMTGCASSFYETGYYSAAPRESGCDVALLTIPPKEHYKEIGTIKFDSLRQPYAVDRLASMDRDLICEKGGNALLYGTPDAEGIYKTATVLLVDWAE